MLRFARGGENGGAISALARISYSTMCEREHAIAQEATTAVVIGHPFWRLARTLSERGSNRNTLTRMACVAGGRNDGEEGAIRSQTTR